MGSHQEQISASDKIGIFHIPNLLSVLRVRSLCGWLGGGSFSFDDEVETVVLQVAGP
jgi:hypothetical protein